jgi:hypothetical protein
MGELDDGIAERVELFERLKMAYLEYRAECSLAWNRHSTFMILVIVPTALGCVLGMGSAGVRALLLQSALTALAGAFITARSHGRVAAARYVLEALEGKLGLVAMHAADGAREPFPGMRVTVALFALLAVLDVGLAVCGR